MKKILIPLALVAGLSLTACDEDRLEIANKGVTLVEDFYKTDEDALSARTAMYSRFIEEIGGNEGIWSAYIMGLNYSADDVFAAGGDPTDHTGFRELNEMRYDASLAPIKMLYQHIYNANYTANLITTYFGGVAEDGTPLADTETKKRCVAEAKVMRAWAHLLAALVYYQPPIIDHIVDKDERPTNAESQEAILKWVIAECEEAMPYLKERNGATDKEGVWYATKGFAQFVAGKAALFLGDNDKVISIMKPLVESENYALVPGERFRDLFHIEGDGCEEKIFELNYTTNLNCGGTWGGSIQRGRWMVANVLNWRGDDIQGGGTNPLICSTGGWGGGSINHEFAHKMLANDGDSYRRKATFLTSDEFFYDATLCPWKADTYEVPDPSDPDGKKTITMTKTLEEKKMDPDRGIKNSNGSFSRSDVMEVKMMCHPNDVDRSVGDNCNNTNLCLARLAEAYLIYAEACIAKGDKAEAWKYIHKIQERAGSKTITDQADINLEVLQNEKEYELWFEGCRWHDLVRWGIAAQKYNEVLDNIPYQFDEYFTSGKTKPHKLYYEVRHPFHDNGIDLKFIEGKHEYWPIPQNIMDMNKNMHQVRGWAK